MEQAENEEVFTPLDAAKEQRLRFRRADVEVLSGDLDVRGVGKKARVRIEGRVYDVYGTACDLPRCECDAYIVPVTEPEGEALAP
jgi:hypothetical protein